MPASTRLVVGKDYAVSLDQAPERAPMLRSHNTTDPNQAKRRSWPSATSPCRPHPRPPLRVARATRPRRPRPPHRAKSSSTSPRPTRGWTGGSMRRLSRDRGCSTRRATSMPSRSSRRCLRRAIGNASVTACRCVALILQLADCCSPHLAASLPSPSCRSVGSTSCNLASTRYGSVGGNGTPLTSAVLV